MTSHRPGSKIGRLDEFHASIRAALLSTTVTLICGFLSAMTAHVGAPIYQSNVTVVNTNITCSDAGNTSYSMVCHHVSIRKWVENRCRALKSDGRSYVVRNEVGLEIM